MDYSTVVRIALAVFFLLIQTSQAVEVGGPIVDASNNPVANARATLFTPNLLVFFETRTSADGRFIFPVVANGSYRIGVSARNFQYVESAIQVSRTNVEMRVALAPETQAGRWTIVGSTSPELLDGTGSGTLLPTGEILFCHDTEDPVVFDPIAALKWFPPTSGSGQGCHIPTLNVDGSLFLAGGSEDGYPQGPVVRTVKQYWRNANFWSRLPDMNVPRWYPSIVRLPNEGLMILGGEQNGGPGRTDACELFNPVTKRWTVAAPFDLPSEITPTVLLYTGEVLKTWRYPEIYNLANNSWRPAPRMLQARIGAATGDHCDHEMVMLGDGRVMTLGILAETTNVATRFCEFYNPERNEWTLGPNPRYLTRQPEAVVLPDGRVLSFGGQYSDFKPPPPLANAGTIPNCTKLADLYDPTLNSWRPLADLNRFIHYHNVTVLVPDGRVIATGGAGLTANNSFAGDDNSIEAYEPPYLFRGVRPKIQSLSTRDLRPGSDVSLQIALTESPTEVLLVSARASTHWVDGGPQRFLSLPFTKIDSTLVATVPNDAVKALAGWYILFVMVDDIPSKGEMVRILPATDVPLVKPTISLATVVNTAQENGSDAQIRFTHTTTTTAPVRIDFEVVGNGPLDLNIFLNYVIIPAGQSTTILRLPAKNDTDREGSKTVLISLRPSIAYALDPMNAASIMVADDDTPPPERRLSIARETGVFHLSYSGPSGMAVSIESSNDLTTWMPFTSSLTVDNNLDVLFERTLPFEFYRAVER